MSTIRCETSSDQALFVLMRHNILVPARFRTVADRSPSLLLAGMISKEVIVSTKVDYYTQIDVRLHLLFEIIVYSNETGDISKSYIQMRLHTGLMVARDLGWRD